LCSLFYCSIFGIVCSLFYQIVKNQHDHDKKVYYFLMLNATMNDII
jgi:hypothetical protein